MLHANSKDLNANMKSTKTILRLILITTLLSSCGQSENRESSTSESNEPAVEAPKSKRLDTNKFEIMTTDHHQAVENFYLLLKNQALAEDSLQVFVDMFREEYCTKQCNINLYDDNSIRSLLTQYPLEGKEYLRVADHYVASSSFDMTEVWLYPFQDIKYKELGGRNWKKDPIK